MGISSRKGAPAPSGAGSRPSGGTPSSGASTYTPPTAAPTTTTRPTTSAAPAQAKAGTDTRFAWEKRLDELAKQKTPEYKSTGVNATPSVGSLGHIRSQQMKQLDDPKVRAAVLARAEIEVGGQPKAQQAWIESLFNRAAANKLSLYDAVANSPKVHRYYPFKDDSRWKSMVANHESTIKSLDGKFAGHLSSVGGGSNITDYATDNASGSLGQRKQAKYGGKWIGGEHFTSDPGARRNWAVAQKRTDEEIRRTGGFIEASAATPGDPSQTGSTKQTNLRPSESFDYENFYKQVGTFREGGGRYGNLNISAGSKTEFGGRGAGAYGGLCGVGVSNAVGVLFGKNEFKKVSGMHAGSFSMAGKNETFQKTGLYQVKRGLSDEEFNNIRAAGNNHGYPPGTIIAVGSTGGSQHIQIWDGRRWISDTVQKGLLGLRRGEGGTAAIHIPNAQGINSLPSSIRQNISTETLEKYVGMSKQDISKDERTAQDNRQSYNSPVNIEKPKYYDKIPEDVRKVIDSLPDSRKDAVYANLNRFSDEEGLKYLSEMSDQIKNSSLSSTEQKNLLSDAITKIETAPSALPELPEDLKYTLVKNDKNAAGYKDIKKDTPYSEGVITHISGVPPGGHSDPMARKMAMLALGKPTIDSTSDELKILKSGVDPRGRSLGYHSAIASFYEAEDGTRIDETQYRKLNSSQKQLYKEKAEIHEIRDPSKIASHAASRNFNNYGMVVVGKMSDAKAIAAAKHIANLKSQGWLTEKSALNIRGHGQLPEERRKERGTYERGAGEGATGAAAINAVIPKIMEMSKNLATPTPTAPVAPTAQPTSSSSVQQVQEDINRQKALSTASTANPGKPSQTGKSTPTDLTPASPIPNNAAQQTTTPPKESSGVFSPASPAPEAKKEEPVPAKYAGGEVQTRGDTATVINDKGEPIARINPDKERISLTETGNLDVQPTYRTDPRTLEQQNAQRQEVGNMNIDDRMQEMSTNIMNQVRQMIPQGGNPNWESMMTSMAAARTLSESPSYTFSNESFRRAMAGARFEKTGDSALGGHFEIANSNLL